MEQLLHFSMALEKKRHKLFSPSLHFEFYIALKYCRTSLVLAWTPPTLSRKLKKNPQTPSFYQELKVSDGEGPPCPIAMICSITHCEVFITGTIISDLQGPL